MKFGKIKKWIKIPDKLEFDSQKNTHNKIPFQQVKIKSNRSNEQFTHKTGIKYKTFPILSHLNIFREKW